MPRWIKAKRVTFKYGLGAEFIDVLKTLHKLGLDKTEPDNVKGVQVSPRDVVAASLPDPAFLGDAMHGATCAGLWVTGTGKDRKAREVYLYHVVDNQETMREYGASAWSGRPQSIRLLPWSCSRRAPGRVPAYSVRKPLTPCRS
jgi:saccharopine dehydrogenase (NAD+, L-lysine forming)